MVDFTQSPFFGPLGAPISQEQALGAVAPPQPGFRPGPQGGPQINPRAGQPTLPPGPPGPPQVPQGPAGAPRGPAGPGGGGLGAFLGSPGLAAANTGLNNIMRMRRGGAPQGNPAMVYGEERRKNAILQERKLRNLEERRQGRKREELLALQTRAAELGIDKAEQEMDPFFRYKRAIEENLIGPEVSLADFEKMGRTAIDPGGHYKSIREWENINPPPNGDYNDPKWLAARSKAYDRILRPLQVVDVGGGGKVGLSATGPAETIVTPETATGRETTLAAEKAGAQETARTEAMKTVTAPATLENIDVTLGSLDALKNDPYLKDVYGVWDANTPTLMQTSIDAKANVNNVVARLVLNEREKLKGQGTISDFESRMLGQASSKLADFEISYEEALKEIERVEQILAGARSRAQTRVNKGLEQSPDGSVRRK